MCSIHFEKEWFLKKREEYENVFSPKHCKVLKEDALPTLNLFWKNESRQPLLNVSLNSPEASLTIKTSTQSTAGTNPRYLSLNSKLPK